MARNGVIRQTSTASGIARFGNILGVTTGASEAMLETLAKAVERDTSANMTTTRKVPPTQSHRTPV